MWQNSWTSGQWTSWATMIADRYKSTPNLIWLVGNDMFSPFNDTTLTAVYSAVTGAGDTHLWGAWYNAGNHVPVCLGHERVRGLGRYLRDFNFCYSYNATYWIIEYAYGEVANEGAASLLPPVWGDGYFYAGSGPDYYAPDDRALRQEWWWSLASGARGILGEAENVYEWAAGTSSRAVTGDWFFANNAANIVTAFTGLGEWHKLIPDLSSALVTAGRGTRVSGLTSGGGGGSYESSFANSYVAASKTPDGTLAVLYLPNSTTVTVNTSLLASGWTATWIDPITGAASSAGNGSTYNSTAKGNNSQGDPDWVLAFQSPLPTTGPALYGFRS